MDVLSWDLVLHKVLPTYLLLGFLITSGGMLVCYTIPVFKFKKREVGFGLLLLMMGVFLAMLALAMIRVHFPIVLNAVNADLGS